MLNPIRLCNNLFDDPQLSDANLRSFTEDLLVRLAQPINNPAGIYNTLLVDTSTKYNNYYGKISSEAVKKAIAEGMTITRNNARIATEDKISSLNSLVKFKFGETSAVYQEFFPQGMMEYTQAREGDVGTLYDRFVTTTTTHLHADYPLEETAITNLVADFHSAYTARETVVAQVDNLITGKNTDRLALTAQLTRNFLLIAADHIGQPDAFDDYYDARFLPIDTGTGGTPAPVVKTGTVNMGMVTNIDLTGSTITATTALQLQNTGTSPLRFYFSNSIMGFSEPPVTSTAPGFADVNPGQTIDKTATELGFGLSHTFLNVQNIGAMQGTYKVTI